MSHLSLVVFYNYFITKIFVDKNKYQGGFHKNYIEVMDWSDG